MTSDLYDGEDFNPSRCKACTHTGTKKYRQCLHKAALDGWCRLHHPEIVRSRNEAYRKRYAPRSEASDGNS